MALQRGYNRGAASEEGTLRRFLKAFDAGGNAVTRDFAKLGMQDDPAGQEHERQRLRARGKWKFVLVRGIVGFAGPMFLWLALTHLSEDIHSARSFNGSTLNYLLRSWAGGFVISAFLGFVVGLLAWRRITSEVWPGTEPDPESCTTTLGPLSKR
jgi:hypothetical protein